MFEATDLAALTDPADFGTVATYNGSTAVNGVFSSRYHEPFGGEVEGQALTFLCAASDLPNAAQNDTLLINGTTYTVVNVRPARGGLIELVLRD
jgi:voltage-gated potassium channel Kch